MNNKKYIVATIRPWNIKIYNERIINYPGEWHLITKPHYLIKKFVQKIKPRYIFFPHWNHKIPSEILELADCICFHETDLPYGKGGSPIQNLISKGHKETMISAIKMTGEIDGGPVFLKRRLSLEGLAEEIYIRASKLIAEMTLEIVEKEPVPIAQTGNSTIFKRRTPKQSEIPIDLRDINELFDHLRMLDATGYPKAFIRYGDYKFEISRPALRAGYVEADVHIIKISESEKND